MAKVLIRGPLLSQSGYGVHSRQVFKWLLKSGHDITCQILPWGITPWYLKPEALDGLIGEIMNRSSAPQVPFDVSFQVQLPDEWDISLAKKNVGITAAVETNFCNPDWITACNKMDGVIVPSDFTKGVLENSGKITKLLKVIPESYPENFADDRKQEKFLKVKSKNNFLLFGQLTAPEPDLDRKNTVNAIKWFCEKFANRKDVGLIIKTNMGTNSTIDKRISINSLKQVIRHVRKTKFPRITLLHGNMNTGELFKLYNDKNIIGLISATRGEGYGLPMIEAAAAGLPVMATDWSGHKTFLQDGHWLPIQYSIKEIHPQRVDNRIFMKESMWADVDEMDFKSGLEKFLKQKKNYREKAISQRKIILEKFSQEAIEKMYDDFMKEMI
tara:strand:+ start:27924 stop:29078 length:1155 start_codon:yes stop_codon:yes gene_type:complete